MARESTTGIRWSPRDESPSSSSTSSLEAHERKGHGRTYRESTALSPEQQGELKRLEWIVAEARRGLKEIKEAFEAKVNDPDSPYRDRVTIEEWAVNFGPYKDTWGQKVGGVWGTQASYMRKDARDYYHLNHKLRDLERELAKYKRALGIQL